MVDKLAGLLLDPLARRWSGQASAATLLFWATGGFLYLVTRTGPGTGCSGASTSGVIAATWCGIFRRYGGLGVAIGAALAAVLAAGVSLAVASAAPRVLDVLTGVAWPRARPMRAFGRRRGRWHRARRGRLVLEAYGAADRAAHGRDGGKAATASWNDTGRHAVAGLRLRHYPGGEAAVAPTRVGNAFAAVAQRVAARHGLDLTVCWGPLLATLPEAARSRLAQESAGVLGSVQTLSWVVAALVWAPLLPGVWAQLGWAAACLAAAAVAHLATCQAVESYCDLVDDTVLVHRAGLYEAIGLPLPPDTADERWHGERLSAYLWRAPHDLARFSWRDDALHRSPGDAEGVTSADRRAKG